MEFETAALDPYSTFYKFPNNIQSAAVSISSKKRVSDKDIDFEINVQNVLKIFKLHA